jgi:hypothetical protein
MAAQIEECEVCGSTDLELDDSGHNTINRQYIPWESYKCLDCGHITSNEPDPDFLKGGHDYD